MDLRDADERLLQQPYDDRQHQAMQGRARLSLAPASSRFFRSEAVDEGQSQLMYQETYDDMGAVRHITTEHPLTFSRSAGTSC
jgi:ATP-dependent DNA helicase HFM1/MER3